MAVNIDDQNWCKFLEQHKSLVSLLDEHSHLLAAICDSCQNHLTARNLVQTRLNHTENLIATFKQSTQSLREITAHEQHVSNADSKVPGPERPPVPIRATKKPKSQKPTNVMPDPSGLFTIDPNPTPVEQLYNDKPTGASPTVAVRVKEGSKRKAEAASSEIIPRTDGRPQQKKTKKAHVQAEPPLPTVEDEVEEQHQQPGPDEDEDNFLKSVAARNQARDEKRKAKADKKRKRESAESVESVMEPRSKKHKEKHGSKTKPTAADLLQKNDAVPLNGEKVSKEKRPRAQTHLNIGDMDENDGNGEQASHVRKRRKGKQT